MAAAAGTLRCYQTEKPPVTTPAKRLCRNANGRFRRGCRHSAKAAIAEIEGKIALQRQRAEQRRSQNKDPSLPIRLIAVFAGELGAREDAC
jgi:hypothetical protein